MGRLLERRVLWEAVSFLVVFSFREGIGFPAKDDGVVLLGAGVTPPSPDLVQQADALEKSGNLNMVAQNQDATGEVDVDASEGAKAVAAGTMVAKADAAGSQPSAVANQAAAGADPTEAATSGPEQDSAEESARSKSVSRAQDINDNAVSMQAMQEKSMLTKAVGPGAASAISKQMDPDEIPDDGNDRVTNSDPKSDPGLPGFHELARMTVPAGKILARLQGSLSLCQDACNRATLCTGIEFSHENGGICILLRHGIRWSGTFEYFEKETQESTDPVRIAKHDKQLMWGRVSDRSHDLGGLAINDVPGSTVYKPPTKSEIKEESARKTIIAKAKPVAVAREQAVVTAETNEHDAKIVQSHMVTALGEARDIAKAVKAKQQRIEQYNTRASLHAAKMKLSAERASAEASKLRAEYTRVKSQAREYRKAATTFAQAGNPMAQAMNQKSLVWEKKARALHFAVAKSKAAAAVERMQAKLADTDAGHWQKQAAWASADETRASQQVEDGEKYQLQAAQALAFHKTAAKEAKFKANCHPLCDLHFDRGAGWDAAGAKTYRPRPVSTKPLVAPNLQHAYTRQSEWEYQARPVPKVFVSKEPVV